MSKGDGGGRTQVVPSGPSNPQLDAFIGNISAASKPILDAISKQILEAITTGGVGAQIPVAQKGVEASRAATSNALTSATGDLARAGLTNSPFGQMILNMMNLSGQQSAEQAGLQPVLDLFSIAPSFVLGTTGQIMSGMGTQAGLAQSGANLAAQLANQRTIAGQNLMASILSPALDGLGGAAGRGLAGWLGGAGAASTAGGIGLDATGALLGTGAAVGTEAAVGSAASDIALAAILAA